MGKKEYQTVEEWQAEAKKLFGEDSNEWTFVCPSCNHVTKVKDWKDAGASGGQIAFSCVGRNLEEKKSMIWEKGKGPCNYAGGGLFQLNPITVRDKDKEMKVFDFYREESKVG